MEDEEVSVRVEVDVEAEVEDGVDFRKCKNKAFKKSNGERSNPVQKFRNGSNIQNFLNNN